MAYASQAGRARTDASSPEAHGICDRCGFRYNRKDLRWQFDFRGPVKQNLRILVCERCTDDPAYQRKVITLPADPSPVIQPRTENFDADEIDSNPVIGAPSDLDINAVMPQFGTQAYRVPLNLISVTANGTQTISVTCRTAHNLVTNAQVAVQGLTNPKACGMYSVTVTGALTFTYQTFASIPAAALLGPSTLMLTALVGIPRGQTQIPQTG